MVKIEQCNKISKRLPFRHTMKSSYTRNVFPYEIMPIDLNINETKTVADLLTWQQIFRYFTTGGKLKYKCKRQKCYCYYSLFGFELLSMCRISLIFSFQSIATSFTVPALEIVVCLFNAFYSCRFQEILDLKLS